MFFRKSSGAIQFLIVGLGNPGIQYENTRHNTGCMALDELARQLNTRIDRFQFKAKTGTAVIGDRQVMLLYPQTFMNLSGDAVLTAMQFYKLKPSQLLVLSDDVSLPLGTIRIRRRGSDGGQRGLRNIAERIGSEDFTRIKIGVGTKPHPDYDLKDWVLSRFSKADLAIMQPAFSRAAAAAALIAQDQLDQAMNQYSK